MVFRRALLGLNANEVESCIRNLEDRLAEKDKTIKELERRIDRLKFDKDDLEAELNVYKAIHQSRAAETDQNV